MLRFYLNPLSPRASPSLCSVYPLLLFSPSAQCCVWWIDLQPLFLSVIHLAVHPLSHKPTCMPTHSVHASIAVWPACHTKYEHAIQFVYAVHTIINIYMTYMYNSGAALAWLIVIYYQFCCDTLLLSEAKFNQRGCSLKTAETGSPKLCFTCSASHSDVMDLRAPVHCYSELVKVISSVS